MEVGHLAKRPAADELTADTRKSKRPHAAPPVSIPERPAVLEERHGDIEFRVVHNDGAPASTVVLTGLKCLFQKQLPNMPKDYIARFVYDRSHTSMAIVQRRPQGLKVIGGIAFRAFRDRRFAEIVFCAVASDQQDKGYGQHLMAHLKDYLRASSPITHLLTYADNQATGYFRKQGFSADITLPRSVWTGYIKDYDGVTLMQCAMLPRLRYLETGRMLRKQKETVRAKIRRLSQSHVVHPSPWGSGGDGEDGGGGGGLPPIDPLSIPAIRASGWSPDMDAPAPPPRHGPHFHDLRRFLAQIQNHPRAWPFAVPVDRDAVPGYYDVITAPMDLSTIEAKLESEAQPDVYASPRDMVDDLVLMLRNCRRYNDPSTVYHKCAVQLEKYMWSLVRKNQWHDLLE